MHMIVTIKQSREGKNKVEPFEYPVSILYNM